MLPVLGLPPNLHVGTFVDISAGQVGVLQSDFYREFDDYFIQVASLLLLTF